MATESIDDHTAAAQAASTRTLEIEIDARLHEQLVHLGEIEGFDAGAELVAMALRELLRRWSSPEQGRLYSDLLHAMHDQAAALRGAESAEVTP